MIAMATEGATVRAPTEIPLPDFAAMPEMYNRACGPRAVGWLLWMSPFKAARELWRVQSMRGRICAPLTSMADMLLLASWHGVASEPWDTSRDRRGRLEDASDFAAKLRNEFRRDIATPDPGFQPDPVGESIAELATWLPKREVWRSLARARENLHSELMSGREWLAEHSAGTWLLHCTRSWHEGRYITHLFAAVDGCVIVGDTREAGQFGHLPLHAAYRVIDHPRRKQ